MSNLERSPREMASPVAIAGRCGMILRAALERPRAGHEVIVNAIAATPNVERAVSQVATHGGRRVKLRYRGTTKNNAWLKRRTAALNLRTLISRRLARVHGTWALAT